MKLMTLSQKLVGAALKASPLALVVTCLLAMSPMAVAQQMEWTTPPLQEHRAVVGSAGGSVKDPQALSVTIPTSTFSHVATKDGKTYTSTIVGTNPFDPSGLNPLSSGSWSSSPPINAVVVPVVFTTGAFTFDPTVGDPNDSNVSALTRFQNSPITNNMNQTVFNQPMGNTQFINAFRRAEFWNTIGQSSAYQNPINFTYAPKLTITGAPLTVFHLPIPGTTLYRDLGTLPPGQLQAFLESAVIPSLQSQGVIGPEEFVIFLFHNVVQAPPTLPLTLVTAGYHGAVGKPVQTYAVVDWDTTSLIGAPDATVASHEIAEWMDDPLGTNLAPAWGYLGEFPTSCSNLWESGDPMTGYLMPTTYIVPTDPLKYPYHLQELAYFSFFFNSPTDPSVGASYYIYKDGTYTMGQHGFQAANVCPPGGLAPFGGKW